MKRISEQKENSSPSNPADVAGKLRLSIKAVAILPKDVHMVTESLEKGESSEKGENKTET